MTYNPLEDSTLFHVEGELVYKIVYYQTNLKTKNWRCPHWRKGKRNPVGCPVRVITDLDDNVKTVKYQHSCKQPIEPKSILSPFSKEYLSGKCKQTNLTPLQIVEDCVILSQTRGELGQIFIPREAVYVIVKAMRKKGSSRKQSELLDIIESSQDEPTRFTHIFIETKPPFYFFYRQEIVSEIVTPPVSLCRCYI